MTQYMIIYFLIGIVFVACLILTPIVIKMAKKFNLVDIPKDSRRVHNKPMPRVGGIAIVTSMYIGLAVYYFLTKNIQEIALNEQFLGFALGGIIIFTMGLIDDIFNLKARYKFIFQLVAAIIVYAFGIKITGFKIPFIYPEVIDFGIFSFPITMIWIIGITNSINLIDGLDGLAAGISAISATALLIIFTSTSASLESIIITAVLVGATLGFLPYNFNPAKTFMGDCSSNFLGFTLSVVSILGCAKGYTILAIIAPILTLSVPIFDTLFAMIRRMIKRQPILKPDGAHIHHRLLKMGFSQKQAVLILYTITSIFSLIAVVIISADIWKLILLILAIISFAVLGIVSMMHKNVNHVQDSTVSKNFTNNVEDKKNKSNKKNKKSI